MEGLLNNPRVLMRDPAAVERKLNIIVDGGFENLIVLSDFDYTLSRFRDKMGKMCWTTHGVFDAALERTELGPKIELLRQKYLPIEFDPKMSVGEKIPHMEKWWRTAHKHIVEAKFTNRMIESVVYKSKIELRDRADAFIWSLSDHRVPLIVFSAGIGNVIEIYLKKTFNDLDNVRVISNMMVFDNDGLVSGFAEPLIHTFCKNGSVISDNSPVFNDISDRPNALLLGDSLGDAHMDVGMTNDGVVLKIGFLNFNVDALLERYLQDYDIVLVDDQTMDVAMHIVESVEYSSNIADQHLLHNGLINAANASCHIEAAEEEQNRNTDEGVNPLAVTANATS